MCVYKKESFYRTMCISTRQGRRVMGVGDRTDAIDLTASGTLEARVNSRSGLY